MPNIDLFGIKIGNIQINRRINKKLAPADAYHYLISNNRNAQ
jgi:hypothetical protein